MSNYCPSCGDKVKKDYKFCLSCGAKLEPLSNSDPSISEEQPTQVPPPQQNKQQQDFIPAQQQKSNKNLLIALIAIIAVVIGGNSLAGGEGGIGKTIMGVVFIAILSNGLSSLGLTDNYYFTIKGTIILLALLFEAVTLRSSTAEL